MRGLSEPEAEPEAELPPAGGILATSATLPRASATTWPPAGAYRRTHEVTKCASKKSVFFSKIKNRHFCLFFRANLTVLGVLVGSAGE
jgi:hypothetical protein